MSVQPRRLDTAELGPVRIHPAAATVRARRVREALDVLQLFAADRGERAAADAIERLALTASDPLLAKLERLLR